MYKVAQNGNTLSEAQSPSTFMNVLSISGNESGVARLGSPLVAIERTFFLTTTSLYMLTYHTKCTSLLNLFKDFTTF